MLVKIGSAWIDPEEIAMILPDQPVEDWTPEDSQNICVQLRHGSSMWIRATMDEAEAVLIDAGYIENPYPEEDEPPELTEDEHDAAADLYDRDFEWLARDKDGKLYAFRDKPEKDGAYWNSFANKAEPVDEDFGFISFEDEEPWSIAHLLLD